MSDFPSDKKVATDTVLDSSRHARDVNRSTKGYVIFIAIIAAFGGLMFGYDIGGSGGTLVMSTFRSHFKWPPAECCAPGATSTQGLDYCMRFGCDKASYDCIATGTVYNGAVLTECVDEAWEYNTRAVSDSQGWISMLFTIGCFCGAITSSWQADGMGRRYALMLHDVVFVVGVALQMWAPTMVVMYIGRFIGGIGIGTLSMLVPLYQSEMAPEHIRGKLVSLQQLCITLGILCAAICNVFFKDILVGWRFSYGGNGFFAIIMFFAMIILPESPRYLMFRGQTEQARKVFQKIRYVDEVEDEMADVQAQIDLELEVGQGTWGQVFSTVNRMGYRTWLGCMLQFLQQWTGINAIMFFAPDILNTFFDETTSLYGNLAIMAFNFLSTFICVYLVDKSGRVPLLFTGGFGMVFNLAACALISSPLFDYKNSQALGLGFLAFCMVYVACFAFSWGPCIWIVCAEIFPMNLRSKAMSLSTAVNWATAALVGRMTPLMYRADGLDLWGTFFLFMCVCMFMSLFVYLFLPETAGVALEDNSTLFNEFKTSFSRQPTSVNRRKTWLN